MIFSNFKEKRKRKGNKSENVSTNNISIKAVKTDDSRRVIKGTKKNTTHTNFHPLEQLQSEKQQQFQTRHIVSEKNSIDVKYDVLQTHAGGFC